MLRSLIYVCFSSSSSSSAPSNLWESTGQEVASALRAMGLPIGPVVTMETRNKVGAREALKLIKETDKVKGQNWKILFEKNINKETVDAVNLRHIIRFSIIIIVLIIIYNHRWIMNELKI